MRRVVIALIVLLSSPAWAASLCGNDTVGRVTIEGFAQIFYGSLFADSKADRAEFSEGVCIRAQDNSWSILASFIELTALSSNPTIDAREVVSVFGNWTITGASLRGSLKHLVFSGAQFTDTNGAYVGSAHSITGNFETSELSFDGLHLTDFGFLIESAEGSLVGQQLTLGKTTISTCSDERCDRYNITGVGASIDLARGKILLSGGVVHLAGIPIPLASTVEISEQSLAKFELPVDVRVITSASGPARAGEGLLFVLKNMRYLPGAKLDAGFSGLTSTETFGVVAVAEFASATQTEADGATTTINATAGIRANRPYVATELRRPVGEHVTFSAQFFSGADYGKDYRHEGLIRAKSTWQPTWVPGNLRTEAFISMLGLAGNPLDLTQNISGLPISDARLGVKIAHDMSVKPHSSTKLSLAWNAQETFYPGHGRHQWGVRLQPELSADAGPFNFTLGYVAQFTNKASPFPASIDKLAALQRATATAKVSDIIPGANSSVISTTASYDFPFAGATAAGLRSWNTTASARFSVGNAWNLNVKAGAELARLLDSRAASHAAVTVSVSAERSGYALIGVNPGGNTELGTNWRYQLTGTPGITKAEVYGSVPFVLDNVELKPYVALDFAGWINQTPNPVKLSGHGIDVTFITCCGAITVGYRLLGSDWDLRLGADFYRRTEPITLPTERGMMAD